MLSFHPYQSDHITLSLAISGKHNIQNEGKDTDELMFAGRAIRSGEIYTGP